MGHQKPVVPDLDKPVLQLPLEVVEDGREVRSLVYVVHVEARLLHVLDKILGTVSVKAHLHRLYLVILHKHIKPVIHVLVVHEALPGYSEDPLLLENVIGHCLLVNRHLVPLFRHEEPREYIIAALPLDYYRGGREVGSSGKVDPSDAITAPEIFQPVMVRLPAFVLRDGLLHVLVIEPGYGAVLFYVAELREKLRFFRKRGVGYGDLLHVVIP